MSRGCARLAFLTQLPPAPLGLCPARMPGGRQSRAETWSLLSDSVVDTKYSGKKWLAPTGETRSGLSGSNPTTCNHLIVVVVSSQEWDEVAGGAHPAGLGGEGQGHSVSFLSTNWTDCPQFSAVGNFFLPHPSWLIGEGRRGPGEALTLMPFGYSVGWAASEGQGQRDPDLISTLSSQTQEERRTPRTRGSREMRQSHSRIRVVPQAQGLPPPQGSYLPILPHTTLGIKGREVHPNPGHCCRTSRRTSR